MKNFIFVEIVKKENFIKLLIFMCLVIALAVGHSKYVYGRAADPEGIVVQEVKEEDNYLLLKGTTVNSGLGFSGYKYKIENDSLYLELHYSLVSKVNPTGDFEVEIKENLQNIKNVYLQGKQVSDAILIFNR
jgi:hypothetical protein